MFRFPFGINYLFLRLKHLFFNKDLRSELNSYDSLDESSFSLQPIITLKGKDNLSFYVRGDVIVGPDKSGVDIFPVSSVVRVGGIFSF